MGAVDIILIMLIAAAVIAAVIRCVKNARRGGCSYGECGGCTACKTQQNK
ncbi:MAG: FeoB-associated Cys-rich membrane protein [Ruminococcus sp.]|nr:FeoB-associated Cys-rich membrane protein [Ruminococcus sp.]